jgi:hypothetical protein
MRTVVLFYENFQATLGKMQDVKFDQKIAINNIS